MLHSKWTAKLLRSNIRNIYRVQYSAVDKDLLVETCCITVLNYCYVCCSGTSNSSGGCHSTRQWLMPQHTPVADATAHTSGWCHSTHQWLMPQHTPVADATAHTSGWCHSTHQWLMPQHTPVADATAHTSGWCHSTHQGNWPSHYSTAQNRPLGDARPLSAGNDAAAKPLQTAIAHMAFGAGDDNTNHPFQAWMMTMEQQDKVQCIRLQVRLQRHKSLMSQTTHHKVHL